MANQRLRVLILDGGRQALPFMRSLKRKGHHVSIVCARRLCEAFFSRYADRRLLWPDYFVDPAGFERQMVDYIRRHRPDVTIAVGDVGAELASRNKPELSRYTALTVPDYELFQVAKDKARTMDFCMQQGIPCPRTFFPERQDIDSISAQASYPVMVKPREGIGAIGLHRIETRQSLLQHYPAIRAKHGELLVQEFIPQEGGMQFQAEAFLDRDSRMKVCLVIAKPRFFPVSGGTSTANVTIHRPDIQETVRRLLEGIRWQGAADVDLILDPRDQIPKVLEINPRVTAGIKIGFAAGIDYADLHVRLALGEPIPSIHAYRMGVYSRNLQMDLLWYLFATRQMRRETQPSFFRFFGRDVCYQCLSADDPMPEIGFFLGMARKYASPGAWRTKLGRDLEKGPSH